MKKKVEEMGFIYKVYDQHGSLVLVTPVKINAVKKIEELKGSPLVNMYLINGMSEVGFFAVEVWQEDADGKMDIISKVQKSNIDPHMQTLDYFYQRQELLKELFG